MLVYRDQKRDIPVRETLVQLSSARAMDHDAVVSLLIEFGELETGIADALEPERDANGPILREFRRTSALIGQLFLCSWCNTGNVLELADRAASSLHQLMSLPLPEMVQSGISEGYAYYGLYSEMYAEAALQFCREVHPDRAVVIGLRNIGTSLSAVVGAAVHETAPVETYTVRPHEHPFDRRLSLAPELEQEWRTRAHAFFLIVDEGPGLSGSSLTSVADRLSELGIPDNRIVFLPSWAPDGDQFVSERARARWRRHRKYVVPFEQVADRGPLAAWRSEQLLDISGGRWRERAFTEARDYPAVHVQHERRKYLTGSGGQHSKTLLKFAGLGRYGRASWERAGVIAQARFGPRPLGMVHGFVESEIVRGAPLAPQMADQAFLDRAAAYLAFVDRTFPASRGESFDTLVQMVQVNTGEALGEDWLAKLHGIEAFRASVDGAPVTALDARMFPHEWLATGNGWIKTDGTEHHDDHFFPGLQNMAWDLAGTCIEFRLGKSEQAYLLNRYAALSGDHGLMTRFPFYLMAYPAFRLGYASFAKDSLTGTGDAERFRELADYYRDRLRLEIESFAERQGRTDASA